MQHGFLIATDGLNFQGDAFFMSSDIKLACR